jgi:hypothetical protein
MSQGSVTKAVVVNSSASVPNTLPLQLALFKADGVTPLVPLATPAAPQADSTATDVTGLKADFNALLAKLRTAGLMRTS